MANFSLEPSNIVVAGRPLHYAWVIVSVAAVMRLFSSSFRSSSSILIPRLVDSFGWSYGAVGLGFAIQWIVSGLFGPTAGWLGDRYGVRWTMRVGAVLFIVGMVLTGLMRELWQFYLFFGVILSISMGIFQVPLTAAITLWFRKHLGFGLGLLQSSQGVGPLIAVPLMLLIIHLFGGILDPGHFGRRRHTVVGPVLLQRAGRDRPPALRRAGRRTHPGGADRGDRQGPFQGVPQAGPTNAGHFWGCAGHAIILIYLVAIAEAEGVGAGVASGAFVTLSVVSSITRFAVPVIADRMGSKGAMAVSFFLQTVPILLLFFAHDAWQFYLFAALFGIGFGGEMTAFPIINRQYYGGKAPIGTTYGYQMMGSGVGMAAGALIGGELRDLTSNFDATMGLSLVLSLTGVISIMLLPTTKEELLPDWEDELPEGMRTGAAHLHAGDDD